MVTEFIHAKAGLAMRAYGLQV